MSTVLPLAYLPSVEYFTHLVRGGCVVDLGEHFVKRSERNRTRILAADGVMELTVHVRNANRPRQPVRDVRIDTPNAGSISIGARWSPPTSRRPISTSTPSGSSLSTAGSGNFWPTTIWNSSTRCARWRRFRCRFSPNPMSMPLRATSTCGPNAKRARRSSPSPISRSFPSGCPSLLICRLQTCCSPKDLRPFRF